MNKTVNSTKTQIPNQEIRCFLCRLNYRKTANFNRKHHCSWSVPLRFVPVDEPECSGTESSCSSDSSDSWMWADKNSLFTRTDSNSQGFGYNFGKVKDLFSKKRSFLNFIFLTVNKKNQTCVYKLANYSLFFFSIYLAQFSRPFLYVFLLFAQSASPHSIYTLKFKFWQKIKNLLSMHW